MDIFSILGKIYSMYSLFPKQRERIGIKNGTLLVKSTVDQSQKYKNNLYVWIYFPSQ